MVEFLITGDLAKQVLGLAQRDPKLARSLAQQFLARVEPVAMQRFLLDDTAAVELLARRLVQDPTRTLDQLQRLPLAKRTRVVATTPARPVAAKSPPKVRGKRRRHRLSAEAGAALKQAIVQYLGAHPGANRRGILSAVEIPSDGLYNRVMGELRAAGTLTVSGSRSSTVYSLKGRGGATGAVPGGKAQPTAKGKPNAKQGKPNAKQGKPNAKQGKANAKQGKPNAKQGKANAKQGGATPAARAASGSGAASNAS
jgi:hypothetical protein